MSSTRMSLHYRADVWDAEVGGGKPRLYVDLNRSSNRNDNRRSDRMPTCHDDTSFSMRTSLEDV